MKIQTFNNGKGLIYGADSKRIGCDIAGVLRIGNTAVIISPNSDVVMPLLVNGCTGTYSAIFSANGKVYELEKVEVKKGRIVPPSPTAVEFMELRCRIDAAEEKVERMEEKLRELAQIFDTNSLNFLIK